MRLKCGQCFEETEQPDERIATGLKTGSYEEEKKTREATPETVNATRGWVEPM
jgi:hypothetical protein